MPRILVTYQIGERSPRLSILLAAMSTRWGRTNVQEAVGGKIELAPDRTPQHALMFRMVVLVIGQKTRAALRLRSGVRGSIEINRMITLLREVREDGVRFMSILIDDEPAPALDALPAGIPALAPEDTRALDDRLANLDDILDEIERRCPPPAPPQVSLHPPIMTDAVAEAPVRAPASAPSSDTFRPPGVHAKPPQSASAESAGDAPQAQAGAEPDLPASPPRISGGATAGTEPPEPVPEPAPAPADTGSVPATSVRLGVSAPARVAPGGEFTARFVAYVAALEDKVRDTLAALSPRATPHLGVRECEWKAGTRVVVTLTARGLAVDPPEQSFAWSGAENLLEFDVGVPADAQPGTIVLKFDAAVEGIAVARLRVDLEIAADTARTPQPAVTTSVEPARSAFASYSSVDRLRVLDRISAVRIATGIDVFVDCLDLRPSEEWKPQLDAEIMKRELFLLFWSKAASESKWVDWEWRTALARHSEDALQVHPLDIGIKPPAELKHLHFGDKYMVARKAFDAPV